MTGATSGLGRLAALALAERGARLHLVCRDPAKAERVAGEVAARAAGGPGTDVRVVIADLSAQAQVRRAADAILATGDPVDVLLNNAGTIFGRRRLSEDGVEMTFALNHLAYFTLTVRLLDRLRASAPARIVNVASGAHEDVKGGFRFEDLDPVTEPDRRFSAYGRYAMSKLANVLFTRELAHRLEPDGITANAVDPGRTTRTGFGRELGPVGRAAMLAASPFLRSPRKGVRPIVHLCAAPEVEGLTGTFWSGMRERELGPAATDDAAARRLWELTASLTGVDDA